MEKRGSSSSGNNYTDLISSLLEVPFSERSDRDRHEILRSERPTPKLSLLQKDKSKSRSFQCSWYNTHKWLCGSNVKGKLFCWPCLLLSTTESVWSSEGYDDLKNLSRAVSKHESSKDHLNSYVSFKTLLNQILNICDILNEHNKLLKLQHNEEVRKNREILKMIIDVTCTLCKQELSFRGHLETDDSNNSGNFGAIFQLVLNRNVDLKEHWLKMEYFRELSEIIENELIECIQEEIQCVINKSLFSAPFFACIVDETSDITEESQYVIIVRFVDASGDTQEYFLGFYDIQENINAAGLCSLLHNVLGKYNVQTKLVAQTYNGASIVAGELNGLQVKVREFAPHAIFTLCFAHDLNLVLQQSCSKIPIVKIFFSTLQGIPAFFHRSSKRSAVLESVMDQRMHMHSEVRWNSNAKIISTVHTNRAKLMQVFTELMNCPNSNDISVREAQGYKNNLLDLNFVFLLSVFDIVFQKTEKLYNMIQKKMSDVHFCIAAVSECILFLKSLRNKQKCIEFFQFADKATGSVSPLQPQDFREENCDIPKYKQLYYEILDNIISQLEVRFSSLENLTFLKLGDTTQFSKYSQEFPVDALDSVLENFGDIFSKDKLPAELETIYSPLHKETFHCLDLNSLIKQMIQNEFHEILPEAFRLFCLIATIPATSASTERNFSCMKRVESYLRNTTTQDQLSALACVSIEKGILHKLQQGDTWYDEIIDRFAKKKERCVKLLFI